LRRRGLQRIEVRVRGEDAPLLRAVAAALADPDRLMRENTDKKVIHLKYTSWTQISILLGVLAIFVTDFLIFFCLYRIYRI
jgi:hypothetical protein